MSEQPDIAGLGSDEIDADYVSELRTSRNRWRREAKDLRVENARLREEWAQEGIGWLRDKDIDRLMGVEDENKRLAAENGRLRAALAEQGREP